MKHYTQEQLLEMVPAYAVGALDAEEQQALQAALAGSTDDSARLRQELHAFQEVARQMATANEMTPAPAVKDRLLARIAAEKSASLPRRARPTATAWLFAATAASLLLAIGLGAWGVSQRSALQRRENTLNAILEADQQIRVARVLGEDTVAGPGIQFFWNEKQRRGVVHAFRMRPAPAGRSYQVWLLQDGKPFSVAVFNSDPDGHALVDRITLPETSRGATLVLVTEEPAGGSPLPTTTPFMRGELGQ